MCGCMTVNTVMQQHGLQVTARCDLVGAQLLVVITVGPAPVLLLVQLQMHVVAGDFAGVAALPKWLQLLPLTGMLLA